jgi:hypothetical protein
MDHRQVDTNVLMRNRNNGESPGTIDGLEVEHVNMNTLTTENVRIYLNTYWNTNPSTKYTNTST